MADIFISYSKVDRDKVVMLAAYLESEGWSVWWDTQLAVGDAYRDEIMKQLAAARAVIVLWTQNSIKSDFVRAEAGRAKADGKLIPVKESDVAYGDIPLPFGEMHTEDLSKRELIRAAVVAQLAKPAVQPSEWWLATREARYVLLSWFGIVGGSITLFANLHTVLGMADWARYVTKIWREAALWLWRPVLSWMGVNVTAYLASVLTLCAFILSIAISVRLRTGRGPDFDTTLRGMWLATRSAWLLQPRYLRALWKLYLGSWIGLLMYGLLFLIVEASGYEEAAGYIVMPYAYLMSIFIEDFTEESIEKYVNGLVTVLLMPLLLLPILSILHNVRNILTRLSEQLSHPAVQAYGLITVITIIFLGPSFSMGGVVSSGTLSTDEAAVFLGFGAMLVAPARPLRSRLFFVLTGLGILIALNFVSLYAPYVRELLKSPV